MAETWVTRWRLEVSPKRVLPGIWRLRGGGFVASAQVQDPTQQREAGKRSKYKTIFRVMREAQTSKDALDWLTAERKRIRETDPLLLTIPLWKDFAVSLLERKVQAGDIESASAIESFKSKLLIIIRTAAWASMPLDEIRRAHIEDWRDTLPTLTWTQERVIKSTGETKVTQSGSYKPRSLNSYLKVVAVAWKAAVVRAAA